MTVLDHPQQGSPSWFPGVLAVADPSGWAVVVGVWVSPTNVAVLVHTSTPPREPDSQIRVDLADDHGPIALAAGSGGASNGGPFALLLRGDRNVGHVVDRLRVTLRRGERLVHGEILSGTSSRAGRVVRLLRDTDVTWSPAQTPDAADDPGPHSAVAGLLRTGPRAHLSLVAWDANGPIRPGSYLDATITDDVGNSYSMIGGAGTLPPRRDDVGIHLAELSPTIASDATAIAVTHPTLPTATMELPS